MGPFVPDPISDQLNLVVALLLGMAFGFVLEQAGFSSSRRLAGVFYGYDFTVVRVFFSAAITAASGVILLGYFGWLDAEAIYINPTWLVPAIVGGVIMGVGFIIGGFCPGTSLCGMAIGKIDAMFFVLGGICGVFGFAEFFPNISTFCDSTSLGPIKVFSSLGLSQGLFVFILIVIAVAMFYGTTLIERRGNKVAAPSLAFPAKRHLAAGVGAVLLAIVLLLLPDRRTKLIETAVQESLSDQSARVISPDELAFWIIDNQTKHKIVDLRSPQTYAELALPNSQNVQLNDLFSKESRMLFAQRHTSKVIVAETEREERVASSLMRKLGFENISVLEGGLPKFRSTILVMSTTDLNGGRWDADVIRFRADARTEILRQIEASKQQPAAPVRATKSVKGGC